MSSKVKTVYICSKCGFESGKWTGRCAGCGEWNTMEEDVIIPSKASSVSIISTFPKLL